MRNIKLTIEFDGTHFNGWQLQPSQCRTAQGEIEKALKKIFKKEIRLHGSGRTDSGVHALAQAAHFKTTSSMETMTMVKALNANLPDDVVILKAEEMPLSFHAQYSVKWKTYRYTLLNRVAPSACDRHFSLHYPYKLNLAAMKRASKSLVGRKDFRAFMASDNGLRFSKKEKSTIRTIRKISISKKDNFITVDIEADGFLYKMVRNIVGTLLEIGSGRLPKGSMKKIIASRDRKKAGETAPAKGLCLLDIVYPPSPEDPGHARG